MVCSLPLKGSPDPVASMEVTETVGMLPQFTAQPACSGYWVTNLAVRQVVTTWQVSFEAQVCTEHLIWNHFRLFATVTVKGSGTKRLFRLETRALWGSLDVHFGVPAARRFTYWTIFRGPAVETPVHVPTDNTMQPRWPAPEIAVPLAHAVMSVMRLHFQGAATLLTSSVNILDGSLYLSWLASVRRVGLTLKCVVPPVLVLFMYPFMCYFPQFG